MPERKSRLGGQEIRRVEAQESLLEAPARLEFQDAEALRDVRRFDDEIIAWHREHTGWSLDLEDESVRLLRAFSALPIRPLHADLQLRGPADYPREPRDYACAVWTLWFAQSPVVTGRGMSRAFLLSELAAGITGRFVAAPYDGWEHWPEHLEQIGGSDLFTLRRIVPKDRGMDWQ